MRILNRLYTLWERVASRIRQAGKPADDALRLVFTGTQVDAKFVKAMLEDHDIPCLLKDPYNESIIAGWVTPGSEHGVRIFVEQKNLMRASYLIEKHFNKAAKNKQS